ncbi:Cytidylate kinase [Paramagnetospirillum magnetotacticum MS-1]|uniref:Cytidylate kinase n=1 Tax=Paramagnetospirillum magnetotacticum MS-1 TaxID=272627 RepID=A0A0C2YCN8_PARME|nr:(d)CMP kinase [Paramagnetospirillum magnetotacticum]KIL97489.1 Cytidylate kinase [Paramagnetospirillum magnetotacticum MS-1]
MTIIAIDGPAAAGKGTLARRLAAELGFDYLDTGLIYRAVGMKLARAGLDPADVALAERAAQDLSPTDLAATDLRIDEAAQAASKVASIPGVRAALLDFQRRFASTPPGGKGAVLDGRDIGTVVCPEAGVKLFVTASVEKRAERRLKELQEKGLGAIYGTVLADMRERDERDTNRAVAPLVPAQDAAVLDTSDLDADQAFAAALEIIRSKR